jgi:hypothetical protein
MAIPGFNEHGWLPEGIHNCTVAEAETRFGSFQGSDRRPKLWGRFKEFHREAKACGDILLILINGSFVTSQAEPNDIDLILVVPAGHDFSRELAPVEYNVLSKRRVYRRYGMDVLVARSDSEEYRRYVRLFQQVRLEPARAKGIVSIRL